MPEDVEGERLPLHRLAPLGREAEEAWPPDLDAVLPPAPARRVREWQLVLAPPRGWGLLGQDAYLRQERDAPAGVPRRRECVEEASLDEVLQGVAPDSGPPVQVERGAEGGLVSLREDGGEGFPGEA